MLAICSVCGKEYQIAPSHLARVKNPTCSKKCNGVNRGNDWRKYGHSGHLFWSEQYKSSKSALFSGDKNPAWRGGVTLRKKKGNYGKIKYVICPEEFKSMARKDGYVMEHRLVVAKNLNRCLSKKEVVHHIDHNPRNNSLANLCLFSNNKDHKLYEGGADIIPLFLYEIN